MQFCRAYTADATHSLGRYEHVMMVEKLPRRAVMDAVLAAGVMAGVKPAEAKGKTAKAGEWAKHQVSLVSNPQRSMLCTIYLRTSCFCVTG